MDVTRRLREEFEVKVYAKDNTLLIHTWNIGVVSRDMEINGAKSRSDVGRIEWCYRGTDDWKVVQLC